MLKGETEGIGRLSAKTMMQKFGPAELSEHAMDHRDDGTKSNSQEDTSEWMLVQASALILHVPGRLVGRQAFCYSTRTP